MNPIKAATRTVSQLIAGSLLLLASNLALSAPVLWTLTDIVLRDGGIATGSFVFDADTSTYSSVLITTSGGSLLPGSTYDTSEVVSSPFPSGNLQLTLVDGFGAADLSGETVFTLTFVSTLTNAGGAIALVGGYFNTFEGLCEWSDCRTGTGLRPLETAASVVGSAVVTGTVPEPGSIALAGLALALAAWGGRRRAA